MGEGKKREREKEFSGVESKRLPRGTGFLKTVRDSVLISYTIFFRNIGKDWNSHLDYAFSKTTQLHFVLSQRSMMKLL